MQPFTSLFAVHIVSRSVHAPEHRSQPFSDILGARAAWLAALQDPASLSARVDEGTEGQRAGRTLCDWTPLRAFLDRTEAHRAETEALCARLTACAPQGYSASVEGPAGAFQVVFHDPFGGEARMEGAVSHETRVRHHWLGYAPLRVVAVTPWSMPGQAIKLIATVDTIPKALHAAEGVDAVIVNALNEPVCLAGWVDACTCLRCMPTEGQVAA